MSNQIIEMEKRKILIYVQYVYGIGHLIRSLNLAKGLSVQFDIYFLSGGEKVKGIEIDPKITFFQLDAVYKKENENGLTPVDDSLSIEECFALREKMIKNILGKVNPDCIITEHFPFGFLFKNESINLIKLGKSINKNLKVVCSVRDVIENGFGSSVEEETSKILNKLYDLLLIHGDENLIPLKSSFQKENQVFIKVYYTGYIVDPRLVKTDINSEQIVLSIAGGRIGDELLIAVERAFCVIKNQIPHNLIIFHGAFNHKFLRKELRERLTIIPFNRKHFIEALSKCSLSISLGGYNTIAEILKLEKKSIIYQRNFKGSNDEQNIRISKLEELDLIKVVNEDGLKKELLSDTILNELKTNRDFITSKINFEGISNSIKAINDLIG